MKKILFLLVFLLSILRGSSLSAQSVSITSSFTLTDSTCSYKYRLTVTATGGILPYLYKLDSLILSSTGVFNNIDGGYHKIEVVDSIGQRRLEFIYLPIGGVRMQAYFYGGATTCDSNNTNLYSLNVTGGQPPYRYFIGNDTVGTTLNSFRLLSNSLYNVVVKDASNRCSFNASLRTPYAFDNSTLYANTLFTPNNCGDSIGTLKVRVITNLRLTAPLSMSFDGRPFSSDSVFSNVLVNRQYSLKVKTQNCGERTTNAYTWHNGRLRGIRSSFTLTNCSTQTGVLTAWIDGGSQPYRVTLDGLPEQTPDSNTVTWSNIRVGSTHTIRVRSAEGCDTTFTIIAKEIPQALQYRYFAACGQVDDLAINLNRNYTYQLDNQSPSRDTGFYVIWQYISQGKHILKIIDSVGCAKTDTITLYGIGLNINTTRTSGICSDSAYSLVVSGGVPPYTYKVDNNAATTVNDFKLIAERYYYVEVTDANYCRFSNYIYVYPQDSAIIIPSISPQLCNSNATTVMFSVPDTNAARPLSISFDGRPFSSDTVFQNVQGGRTYTVIVKSKQGCNLRASLYVPGNNSALNVFLRDTCVNRLGNTRLSPMIYGGVSPYRFAWNTGQMTWDVVVPVGQYSIIVTDANGCQATATAKVTSCVWSGDTDTSSIVDNRDLLNIGLAFGEIGPKRCPFDSIPNHPYCTAWDAQKATDWSKQTPAGTNYKHIDTNGDGIVNAADTIAIYRNWNQAHQSAFPATGFAAPNTVPPIYIQTSNVREGDWASFPIMLGETGSPAENIYGLAFSVKYPPSVIEPNSMRLVVGQSWLSTSSELLNVFKDEYDNTFHVGLVKTNRQNSTGTGQIATLTFKLRTGISGADLQFGVYNDYLINNLSQQIPSIGRLTTVKVLTTTNEPIWSNQIHIYPNPTRSNVIIDAQNIVIQSVTVLDIAGKMIQRVDKSEVILPNAGTYFLKIETDKGVLVRKIVKM